jgi:guanylate kinase
MSLAAGAGRDQLVQQLLQRFPQRFAVPRQITDRKPGKGEKEAAADVDFVKADVLSKMAAQGQVVWSSQDAAGGGGTAVTAEAVGSVLAAGEVVHF